MEIQITKYPDIAVSNSLASDTRFTLEKNEDKHR